MGDNADGMLKTLQDNAGPHQRFEEITLAEAMATASNPHDLKVMLERQGILQTGSFAAQLS